MNWICEEGGDVYECFVIMEFVDFIFGYGCNLFFVGIWCCCIFKENDGCEFVCVGWVVRDVCCCES